MWLTPGSTPDQTQVLHDELWILAGEQQAPARSLRNSGVRADWPQACAHAANA